jgi:hypothetical protein
MLVLDPAFADAYIYKLGRDSENYLLPNAYHDEHFTACTKCCVAGADPVGITGSESEISDQAIGYSCMKVEVYGGDHSPWVQLELLALHEKGIDQPVEGWACNTWSSRDFSSRNLVGIRIQVDGSNEFTWVGWIELSHH